MKDCAGQNIEIGQLCASNHAGYTCGLVLFEVVGFTNKKVKLLHHKNQEEECLKFPEQICVIASYKPKPQKLSENG